jgi:cytochrome c-type protein NapC
MLFKLFYKIKRLSIYSWRRFLCSSFQYAFITLLLTFMTGIFAWGSFNWAMELSNSESFCISCHEMEENVYQEYKGTIHDVNQSGVRASCPDCHVPREWGHKVIRKITASNELIKKVLGTINTREKFLARRPILVKRVWKAMKDTDSRECRNCHSFTYMDPEKQQPIASKNHIEAEQQNRTCIDCHMGIAHELPEELLEKEHVSFEQQGMTCGNCHAEMGKIQMQNDWDWDDE